MCPYFQALGVLVYSLLCLQLFLKYRFKRIHTRIQPHRDEVLALRQ